MSTVDVKSLFKSGKKTIKAFKVATGPATESKDDAKTGSESLEHWESPAPSATPPVTSASAGLDDYKGEEEQQNLKPVVSWKAEPAEPVKEAAPAPVSSSAYKPPSQRRVEGNVALPSLSEAVKVVPVVTTARPGTASTGSTGRLKLITAASKKALEEEEKKKELERVEKEKEKQARKEQLKADLERQESAVSSSSAPPEKPTIQAASLEQVYAKYVNREKTGRRLVVS